MDRTILISLSGHAEGYRLQVDAYDRLATYLDRAASGLGDDPDRAEIVDDLERSVGDKLQALLGSDDRVVVLADIDGILEEIGAVETGTGPVDEAAGTAKRRPRGRRLSRIKEGQMLTGVCNGLAAYADLRVDWVRTLFIFATMLTAGLFAVVYVAMVFILPVDATREEYEAARR